jgi:acetyl esterase/lipase
MHDLVPYLDPELVEPFLGLQSFVASLEERDPDPRVRRRDLAVPGPGGGSVPVRLYEPAARPELVPAVLYVHGGGFVSGSVSQSDALCEELALACEAAVVSVEYRLAPRHPFPAAAEDAHAALVWLVAKASELGVDPARVALAGSSAGGCIAAETAFLARDRGEPALALLLLLSACLDDRHTTESSRSVVDGRVFNRQRSLDAWAAYLGGAADPPPRAVPARELDLSGLPPVYLALGQLDVVRDENVAFAARLMAAGVPTELHVYPGAFHGFDHGVAPAARVGIAAVRDRHDALRRALQPLEPS